MVCMSDHVHFNHLRLTVGRYTVGRQYRLSIDRQCQPMYLSTVGRHSCRYSVGGITVICRWHSGHKTKCLKQWYCIALLSSYYEGRGEKENRHNSLNIKRNGLKFHTVLKKYTTNKYEYFQYLLTFISLWNKFSLNLRMCRRRNTMHEKQTVRSVSSGRVSGRKIGTIALNGEQ